MTLVVEETGPLALLQDRGRPGHGHLGVSPSGAFDRTALRQVNLLLGNQPDAAALELLGGGLVLRAEDSVLVAVTGAVGPITIDGDPVAYGRAVSLRPGRRLRLGAPTGSLRTYVGVAGGFVVAHELGSASTDTLAGLGPGPVVAGDRLVTGPRLPTPDLEDLPALGHAGDLVLDVAVGPRDDWFTAAAVRSLLESAWQVSPTSSRVGVRLTGPRLVRSRTDELPSEPCLRGSIQVSADGQPIVLGPDHPVTGGYPVIAVVLDRHTDRLAQAQPGRIIRFRGVSLP
ncbi:allophanate hydrolase [Aeromicrobium sp. A1-2]|uniref:5-oxoprolinase subunit C family protein n=1 Tax=Aeromicrobium sp. A1-2 TaxID=2107713 RepID=UPI000E4EDA03|nr:biotin-dependent carboxyltransferase family protein [Aeromicrobium sp. A1-2]AXT84046.1 allophanate hydrolase [Aeromicrobium sp. A1-2]